MGSEKKRGTWDCVLWWGTEGWWKEPLLWVCRATPGPMEYKLIEAGLNKATTQECHHREPFNSWPWGSDGDGREKGTHIYSTPTGRQEARHKRTHIILSLRLSSWGRCYCSHFTDNKMETLRALSHTAIRGQSWDSNSDLAAFKILMFFPPRGSLSPFPDLRPTEPSGRGERGVRNRLLQGVEVGQRWMGACTHLPSRIVLVPFPSSSGQSQPHSWPLLHVGDLSNSAFRIENQLSKLLLGICSWMTYRYPKPDISVPKLITRFLPFSPALPLVFSDSVDIICSSCKNFSAKILYNSLVNKPKTFAHISQRCASPAASFCHLPWLEHWPPHVGNIHMFSHLRALSDPNSYFIFMCWWTLWH